MQKCVALLVFSKLAMLLLAFVVGTADEVFGCEVVYVREQNFPVPVSLSQVLCFFRLSQNPYPHLTSLTC